MTYPCEPTGPEETPPGQPEERSPVTAPDQRGHVRYYYSYRPPARYGERGGVRQGEARLHDLALGGLALLSQQPIPPGTVLLVRLPAARPGGTLTQLAQVVRARRLGPLCWLIGCEFLSRLQVSALERVLGKAN